MDVTKAITINRTPEEVYSFWRDIRNLPRFTEHLAEVQTAGDGRSHWKAKAPAGVTIEWDAMIVEDQPNALIAWRSLEGAAVNNAGSVRFTPAPGDRGTEVRVQLSYDPPAGALGAAISKVFGKEPGDQVGSALRRFKQVLETGEITQSDASFKGGGPAQPPAEVSPKTAAARR